MDSEKGKISSGPESHAEYKSFPLILQESIKSSRLEFNRRLREEKDSALQTLYIKTGLDGTLRKKKVQFDIKPSTLVEETLTPNSKPEQEACPKVSAEVNCNLSFEIVRNNQEADEFPDSSINLPEDKEALESQPERQALYFNATTERPTTAPITEQKPEADISENKISELFFAPRANSTRDNATEVYFSFYENSLSENKSTLTVSSQDESAYTQDLSDGNTASSALSYENSSSSENTTLELGASGACSEANFISDKENCSISQNSTLALGESAGCSEVLSLSVSSNSMGSFSQSRSLDIKKIVASISPITRRKPMSLVQETEILSNEREATQRFLKKSSNREYSVPQGKEFNLDSTRIVSRNPSAAEISMFRTFVFPSRNCRKLHADEATENLAKKGRFDSKEVQSLSKTLLRQEDQKESKSKAEAPHKGRQLMSSRLLRSSINKTQDAASQAKTKAEGKEGLTFLTSETTICSTLVAQDHRTNFPSSPESAHFIESDIKFPLRVSKQSLSWDSVKLRKEVSKSLKVTNIGDQRLSFRLDIKGPGFHLASQKRISVLPFEVRTIKVVFYPTVIGASIGALIFRLAKYSAQGNASPIEVQLFAFGGHTKLVPSNILKGPSGSPFLIMGDVRALTERITKTFKIFNRGNLLAFASITLGSFSLNIPRFSEAFSIEPSTMLIKPGQAVQVSIVFSAHREDVKPIIRKIKGVLSLANMRIVCGDESNRQRIRQLLHRMPEAERMKMLSNGLDKLWTTFPEEITIEGLQKINEQHEVVSDLISCMKDYEVALTINDNNFDDTLTTSFCCSDEDEPLTLYGISSQTSI